MKILQTTLKDLSAREVPLEEGNLAVYVKLSTGQQFALEEYDGNLVVRLDSGGMKILPHVSNSVSLGAAK